MSDDTSNELDKPVPSKAEAVEFTSDMRDALDSFGDAASNALDFLRKSQEIDYWKGFGNTYTSWLDWYHEEFEDQLAYLKELKLNIDVKAGLVQVLNDGGLTKKEIAETLGVHRNTVTNTLRANEESAQRCASTEVDAAGQSVESVGHIDEPQPQSLTVPTGEQLVIGNEAVVDTANNDDGDPFADRFAGIDFGAMIISPPPQQIIQAESSEDTPDYFVPRSVAPSWSPPVVGELPPPATKAYHDAPEPSAEFLEPPMKLQKAGEANKTPEDKHCRTCACNLLP